MAISRRVRYGFGAAIGAAVVILTISSQQGIKRVVVTPGLISGSGTPSNPIDVKLTTDGTSVTGTGSSGSPLEAPALGTLDMGLFGDGRDGSSSPCGTISVDTTLSRTIWCDDLTIDPGVTLNPAGWRIFVRGTLTLNGKIARNGGNATSSTNGAGAAGFHELCGGGTGGTGGLSCFAGGAPTSVCGAATYIRQPDECSASASPGGAQNGGDAPDGGRCKGGGGGGGQNAGNGVGCSGGGITVISLRHGSWRAPWVAYTMIASASRLASSGNTYFSTALTGGTGGGGGSSGDFGGCTLNGRGGGGGGVILVVAKKIVGSGVIEAKGGNGANAQGSGSAKCGGGGGGAGCVISVFIGTGSFPSTDVSGGNGGTGGTNGGDGGDGGEGVVVKTKAGV